MIFNQEIRHLPVEDIIKNTLPALKADVAIYIATDEHEPSFLDPWRETYKQVYNLDANFTQLAKATKSRWLGITEMLVASQADIFIGSRLSTFSGYITRLRGYSGQRYLETHFTSDNAEDWLELERTQGLEGQRVGDKLPLWQNGWQWSTWGREFMEAYNAKINLYNPIVVTAPPQPQK